MSYSDQPIPQFELSPFARAGVALINLGGPNDQGTKESVVPHRDTHYLLALATQGYFRLSLDFNEIAFKAPALLFIAPGQVHQFLEQHDPQGWAISFDPLLVDTELQLVLEQGLPSPLLLESLPALHQQLTTLMALVETCQDATPTEYTNKILHALLAALLSLIAGQLTFPTSGAKTKLGRGKIIEQGFLRLLKQQYIHWKQPSRYAAELAVSVTHLNDTVKVLTGQSVSAHIKQRSVLEAKRLLCYTQQTVREIGYTVGYDDPVHFSKLFKEVTKLTPRQFRYQFRD